MLVTVWLKIQGKKKYNTWQQGMVSAFKLKPSLADNEIALKFNIEIPDEVFEEPVYEVKLSIPKVTKNLPELSQIAKSVGKELSKQIGLKVKVEIPQDETLDGS